MTKTIGTILGSAALCLALSMPIARAQDYPPGDTPTPPPPSLMPAGMARKMIPEPSTAKPASDIVPADFPPGIKADPLAPPPEVAPIATAHSAPVPLAPVNVVPAIVPTAPPSLINPPHGTSTVSTLENPDAPPPVVKSEKKHAKISRKHHGKASAKVVKAHAPTKQEKAEARLRMAQGWLDQLNYNPGKIDGKPGKGTKAALKAFQKDHVLPASGELTPKTYDALASEIKKLEAAKKVVAVEVAQPVLPPTPEFFMHHPDYYGYYSDGYTNPTMLQSPQGVPTRYGDLSISDKTEDSKRHFEITLNGGSVFTADDQPGVVNISRTFNLDEADAFLITSFAAGDTVCPYRHYLVVVRQSVHGVLPIANCTRDYGAYTAAGSLFISFPEKRGNGWAAGSMWRYENGALQQL
jgi:peptidoglycan hydrolase-like protein with peptidoglycan-binding domain